MNYEDALVGAVVASGGRLPAETTITPADFTGPGAIAWAALLELSEKREPFDMLFLKDRMGASAFMDLLRITESLQDPGHLEWYAKKLKNESLLREIRRRVSSVVEHATDYRATVEALGTMLAEFATGPDSRGFRSIQELAGSHLRLLQSGNTTGLDTGFGRLDSLLMGLKPGAPYVIGGRTSNGKTMLAFQMAMQLARAGHPVAYFLLETSGESLAARGITHWSKLPSIKLLRSEFNSAEDWSRIVDSVDEMEKVPLYIDDSQDLNVSNFPARVLRAREAFGCSVVFLDHMQIIGSKGDSRKAELDLVSRTLCKVSIESAVPIVALSQLSRSGRFERPDLSHLKESGNIENDSEVCIMVYRHEELNRQQDWFSEYRKLASAVEASGAMVDEGDEIIYVEVLKNRQAGRLGIVPFRFSRKYGRLDEI